MKPRYTYRTFGTARYWTPNGKPLPAAERARVQAIMAKALASSIKERKP